tara:strand:- start:304 stop:1353 length:1050 start_codon:yes stop_codon:yes gene_type:complete
MILVYFYTLLGINNKNNFCSYIYSFLILCLLIFNPIYSFLNNQNINNIGFILYKLNYIANFLFLYLNFSKILEYKYLENINFRNILIIFQIFTLFIYVLNLYVFYKLQILNISNNIVINILINISDFYGIYCYINNILFFILIFIKLLQDIYLLDNDLNGKINNNNNKGLINIFYNIVDLKYKVTYSINDFNNILNLFTIINLFSLGLLYYVYNSLFYNQKIYFYILTTYFIIIEIICLGIVLLISKYRTEIFNKIYEPLFINNFIKKYDINTFNDTYEVQLNVNNIDINTITLYNILEENSTSIDWIILNITLNSKWVDFDLFGIQIHSMNSINQIVILITLFYKIIT